METFSKYTQYIPSLKEVQSLFIDNGFTAAHGTGWYNKMQTSAWLDGKGNKIMNWSKYARFKIDDLKGSISADIQSTPTVRYNSVEAAGLAPVLIELIEGIVDLIQGKTKKTNPAFLKVTADLIKKLQQSLNMSAEDTNKILLESLREIVNEPAFRYDDLLFELDRKIDRIIINHNQYK